MGEGQRDSEQRFPDLGDVSLKQAVFVVASDGSLNYQKDQNYQKEQESLPESTRASK